MKNERENEENKEQVRFTIEGGRFIQATSKLYWKKNILDFYFKNNRQLLIFKNKNFFATYLPLFFIGVISFQTYGVIDAIVEDLPTMLILVAAFFCNILIAGLIILVSRRVFKAWFRKVELKRGFPLFVENDDFNPKLFEEKNEYFFNCCREDSSLDQTRQHVLPEFAKAFNREEYYKYIEKSGLGWGDYGFFRRSLLGLACVVGLFCGMVIWYLLNVGF